MSLLYHDDPEHPENALSFVVLGEDGVTRRYARQDFDQILCSTDPEEVRRQVALGWMVLDERRIEAPESAPSSQAFIPAVEGANRGGLGREPHVPLTSYVVGCLRDADEGLDD